MPVSIKAKDVIEKIMSIDTDTTAKHIYVFEIKRVCL